MKALLLLILIPVIATALLNFAVIIPVYSKIVSPAEAAARFEGEGGADCIIVLGASVNGGRPSEILAHRLDEGIAAFDAGGSNLFLLSGDNMVKEYNEAQAMNDYVLENGAAHGITADNIYLDYAGFSTYDTMKRAKDIFGAKKVIVVTQRYHLYRALYIAEKLGLEAVGLPAENRSNGQLKRDLREIPARVKDFFMCIAEPAPTAAGDPIPLQFPSTQNN
jgi:vancomycin permeability regulator SanA